MLLTKEVEVSWERANKRRYVDLGYEYTKLKDKFTIPIEHLSKGSHVDVEVLCDYCNKNIITKEYRIYIVQNEKSNIHKDCCDECWNLKLADSMELKYNCSNASNIKEFQNKRNDTFIERFGANPMQIASVVQKGKNTNIQKYGVTHKMKLKGEYASRVTKMKQTMYENGNGACSKPQKYLSILFDGKLNYPLRSCLLDIAYPEEKIYIEFLGGGHYLDVIHGHITQKQKEHNDRKRFYALRKEGWKLIHIISQKDKIPSDTMLIELLSRAKQYLNAGHTYFEINIDENILKCSEYTIDYDFGKTRRIYQKDIDKISKSFIINL